MSGWDFSAVVIVPAALQDKANRLTCALGYDVLPGNTFSVALSADGQEPVTHYGARTWCKEDFLIIMNGAESGVLPDIDWSEYGVTPADIAEVIGSQIFAHRGAGEAAGHLEMVAADNDLQIVSLESEVFK